MIRPLSPRRAYHPAPHQERDPNPIPYNFAPIFGGAAAQHRSSSDGGRAATERRRILRLAEVGELVGLPLAYSRQQLLVVPRAVGVSPHLH